ncbi:DELLA protein GAIP-like [Dorcoceras hygrometricum]|uniref:DELLA protein GAIP-like n=1 Tax=Dorcoceras hygrometricum TaxID=472368 RepID=A0A2Z7B692_9LAMI|nr:DELLA protein GAIP-like [Dorcoceras hygrometricum]
MAGDRRSDRNNGGEGPSNNGTGLSREDVMAIVTMVATTLQGLVGPNHNQAPPPSPPTRGTKFYYESLQRSRVEDTSFIARPITTTTVALFQNFSPKVDLPVVSSASDQAITEALATNFMQNSNPSVNIFVRLMTQKFFVVNSALLDYNKEGYLLGSHNEGYLLISHNGGYLLVSIKEEYLLVSSKEEYLLVSMQTTQLLNSNKGMQLLVSTRKDAPADEQCIC